MHEMLGVAGWCGTVNGMPALQLSTHGGATLWVYDGGWRIFLRSSSLADLSEEMGLPYDHEKRRKHLTIELKEPTNG